MTAKKISAMNFDSLDTVEACEKPYEFELVHPSTKEPLGVFVSVVGPESSAFKNRVFRQVNQERRRAFEMQRKGKDIQPKTLEEDEAESISLVADLVTGWRTVIDGKSEPVIFWGEEKLEFNDSNLVRWLTKFRWVRAQIDEAATDLGNFMPA